MYEKLSSLNGDHPWRSVWPDAYVDYYARYRPGGRPLYFNYDLAKELQILPDNHARRMTRALEEAILQTFCLQIINEYDREHSAQFDRVRPKPYMATRYLQAQHKDKRGKTSGDGRAIWNGQIEARGVVYDVSSRGTGATKLSPGAQLAKGPVKTGDGRWGYSCGTADLDEMISTAIMSEIFHRNGFPTERTLAVIDFGDGNGIGVRVAPNLIRPAHIFRYLKQGRRDETRAAMEFFVGRQVQNGEWTLPAGGKARYRKALRYIAESYGKLAAIMEEEYIFNWLAWDGDNMLASGAILDYGSIRQFAAKHDQYRFDDVDRFSSNLGEQRFWARQLVKVFAQAAHFARTGRKLNLSRFKNARCLDAFDRTFAREKERRILWRLGFTPSQIENLQANARTEIGDLRRALDFFEEKKVARGIEKLPDGVTHSPVFLIRNLLRKLPAHLAEKRELMSPEEFYECMAASYASRRDLKLTATRMARARNFQKCYQRLIAATGDYEKVLEEVRDRSAVINYEHRLTGNGVIYVVDEVIKVKDKIDRDELQGALDAFITSQVLMPGQWRAIAESEIADQSARAKLLRAFQESLEECKETI